MTRCVFRKGFTLIELMLVIAILVISLAAILAAVMGQLALSEHARNMSLALNDVNRVVEQIRQVNRNCATPNNTPPAGFRSWDLWLEGTVLSGGGGGKSLPAPSNELVMVSCVNAAGAQAAGTQRCAVGATPQIGQMEWNFQPANPPAVQQDPMQVTVSVCWRHRGRVIGECLWPPGAAGWDATPANWDTDVAYPGTDRPNIIDSPVSVTTLVTCR